MPPMHPSRPPRRYARALACLPSFFREPRAGQALIETLIVVILLVAAFLFFFDFTTKASARVLLENAAARVARADTVGFNDFQCAKSLRVSMIPVSGTREWPDPTRFSLNSYAELAYARAYLQAQTYGEANGTLRYERWKDLSHRVTRQQNRLRVEADFAVPAQLPQKLARIFGVLPAREDGSPHPLRAEWAIEDHASFYLTR